MVIHVDIDLAVDETSQKNAGDTRKVGEAVLQLVSGVEHHVLGGQGWVGGDGEPDDGRAIGVELPDDRRIDILGQVPLDLEHGGLHVLDGDVHVPADIQLNRDI